MKPDADQEREPRKSFTIFVKLTVLGWGCDGENRACSAGSLRGSNRVCHKSEGDGRTLKSTFIVILWEGKGKAGQAGCGWDNLYNISKFWGIRAVSQYKGMLSRLL